MTEPAPRKSDLGVRVASAVVMVAVAGTALWLGGGVWTFFVALVFVRVMREWWGLVQGFVVTVAFRSAWLFFGIVYVGLAALFAVNLRNEIDGGWIALLLMLLGVIGTDVGAYFSGRVFGGPKIAPSISPSKTWSGLLGGILGAAAGVWITIRFAIEQGYSQGIEIYLDGDHSEPAMSKGGFDLQTLLICLVLGSLIAVVAQSGDFFESWMKRRAGVKDSGKIIPGHGGVFDRLDGLLAVMFIGSLLFHLISWAK